MTWAIGSGTSGTGFWNPNEQFELDPETGQYTQKPALTPVPANGMAPFDPSKAPGDVPMDWAQDFVSRNPGDYHRISAAYESDRQGKAQQQAAPQYQTPTQQWNAQPQQSPQSNALYAQLMQRATQGTAVSRNDPNIRAQVDPVVAQQERASRNYLDDVAERSGPLANLQGERRLASERSGQAAGAFESEVIGREIAARRDEIAQALSLYAGQLSSDQDRQLRQELAQLDAMLTREGFGLQREGMAQSNDEFMRELALREYDTVNKWDYNWAGLGA